MWFSQLVPDHHAPLELKLLDKYCWKHEYIPNRARFWCNMSGATAEIETRLSEVITTRAKPGFNR